MAAALVHVAAAVLDACICRSTFADARIQGSEADTFEVVCPAVSQSTSLRLPWWKAFFAAGLGHLVGVRTEYDGGRRRHFLQRPEPMCCNSLEQLASCPLGTRSQSQVLRKGDKWCLPCLLDLRFAKGAEHKGGEVRKKGLELHCWRDRRAVIPCAG